MPKGIRELYTWFALAVVGGAISGMVWEVLAGRRRNNDDKQIPV